MVSTWRKPAVVTKAARAPLPSRIMLVATVVPCSTRSSDVAAWPASPNASFTPVRKAWLGSVGTEGVLARQMRPLLASCSAISVKVPPISMAMARDVSGEGVDIRVTMERFGCGTLGAKPGGGGLVDAVAVDGDAIEALGAIDADETAEHVFQHLVGRTIERMAMAAAAAGLDTQHIALLQDVAVGERLELALVVGAGIDDDAARAARHAAIDAPRRVLHAVDADGHHRFLGLHLVLTHDATAAAITAGAAGIGQDAVGAQPHRVAILEELHWIVFLRDEIDRVGAV